jgi:Uma2 family endonuclease
MVHEIVLPETKPETEWVRGRALQKVSPTYPHARIQGLLFTAFSAWADADDRGRVGTEWRFRVAPPGQIVRPLVPDLAFLAYTAFPKNAPREDLDVPLGAPTVAVEVLSPDDRAADVRDKIATYLAAGTSLVLVVDPEQANIVACDRSGERTFRSPDSLTHTAMPGFSLDVGRLFASIP